MNRTLLLLSGGADAAEIARRIREIGHTVVVSDANPEAPAFAFADSCLIADVQGASETAAAAERYNRKIRKIDGVLCAAPAALTAATVADRLRLPGLPLHVAELIQDRLRVARCFQSAGIAAPWQTEVCTPQELQRAVIARGRALVVKPVDNRGPDGVQRLAESEDFAAAFQQARAHSADQRVMVEEELEGPGTTVAAFMLDGICHAEAVPEPIREMAGRAASALGISNGPMTAQLVMHRGAPHVTEISPRLGGSAFLNAAIALALGEAVQDLRP